MSEELLAHQILAYGLTQEDLDQTVKRYENHLILEKGRASIVGTEANTIDIKKQVRTFEDKLYTANVRASKERGKVATLALLPKVVVTPPQEQISTLSKQPPQFAVGLGGFGTRDLTKMDTNALATHMRKHPPTNSEFAHALAIVDDTLDDGTRISSPKAVEDVKNKLRQARKQALTATVKAESSPTETEATDKTKKEEKTEEEEPSGIKKLLKEFRSEYTVIGIAGIATIAFAVFAVPLLMDKIGTVVIPLAITAAIGYGVYATRST
jgi:hypothetical protein